MSLHLQRFVDRVRGAESRGLKDLSMSITEAKDLHADITRLLLELEKLRGELVKTAKEDVITVQIGGGSF